MFGHSLLKRSSKSGLHGVEPERIELWAVLLFKFWSIKRQLCSLGVASVMEFKTKNGDVSKYRTRKHRTFSAMPKRLWDIRTEVDLRLLRFVWATGLCFLGISILATHFLSAGLRQDSHIQRESGTLLGDSEKKLTVTILTAPDPFDGNFGIRQAIAIDSWLRLEPQPTVILLSQDFSVRAFASRRAPRVTVEDDIDFTYSGKPFFHTVVQRALRVSADIVVLIESDVILSGHVMRAFESVRKLDQDWLLTALPLVVPATFSFLQGELLQSSGAQVNERQVEDYVRENTTWGTCEGASLWAWNGNGKPLYAGIMPPFVYKEGQHNHWLLTEAITSKYRIVLDASKAFNVFRAQLAWNTSQDDRSGSLPEKSEGDQEWKAGNSWLASRYGSHYFRPLNFSNISLKLLKVGDSKSEKFCMMNISEYPFSCSPVNPASISRDEMSKEGWPIIHHQSPWTSWFKGLVDWSQTEQLSRSRHTAGGTTHFSVVSVEDLTSLPAEGLRKVVTSYPSMSCANSKPVLSKVDKTGPQITLASLVEKVADHRRMVILAVVGNSYRDMLMSWVCRLKNLGLSNFLVSAIDDEIFHFATLQGLPVFKSRLDLDVSRDDCHFGTECFQFVTKMKSRAVLQILRLGYHVLFSDVDVYWFKDPSEELMSYGPGHLPAQSDQWNETEPLNEPRRLNSGFYFAWADNLTISAFERIVLHGLTSNRSEQPSFYDTLCGSDGEYMVGNDLCFHPNLNMTVHFLDPLAYPNGAYRLLWNRKDVRGDCLKQGCVVLHNNWVPGRQNKMKRQIASGLWDYDGATRMCVRKPD